MFGLLMSCGTQDEKGVIQDTGEVISGYADTLDGSIGDAKAIKVQLESQDQDLLNQIQDSTSR